MVDFVRYNYEHRHSGLAFLAPLTRIVAARTTCSPSATRRSNTHACDIRVVFILVDRRRMR
jgi:hypothetical protein